jgi:nucleoside 2-deoxyribosyltransferase
MGHLFRGVLMTRAYIAGPISGLPNGNRAAFDQAAARLMLAGYSVVNPHDINAPYPNPTWSEAMRRDIKVMVDCDVIILLPGWGRSRGALLERQIAIALGLRVLDLCDIGVADELGMPA